VGEHFFLCLKCDRAKKYRPYPWIWAKKVIDEKLTALGGRDSGGIIALDRYGRISMRFNTEGMYRGFVTDNGKLTTLIYKDE
jgi:beta-aspartyl-peptidase (threonine type)